MKLGNISTPMLLRRPEEISYVDDFLKAVPIDAEAIQIISDLWGAFELGGYSRSPNSAPIMPMFYSTRRSF